MDKHIYHTGAWTRLRLQALNRDRWLCQYCLARGRFTYASEVHHLVPVEADPTLALTLSRRPTFRKHNSLPMILSKRWVSSRM